MGADGWGGVERWFLDTAEGLRARGHRVLSAGRPGSLWVERSRKAGFETRETPLHGDFPWREARALARWMRGERVDLLATKLHRGIRAGGLAARLAGGVPVVAFMGLVEVRRGWRFALTYRLFLDRILTLAPGMRREILEIGRFPPEMVEAIPYGVVPSAYETPPEVAARARAGLGALPGETLLVAAGRLHEQKRFDVLLEAFRSVLRGAPAARLAIVGTGKLRGALEEQARALEVAGRVTFAGFRTDMPAVLAAADLFVMSSDDEGLPMVVLEAMASGLPVVATEVGALRDLVEEGVHGRLVPPRDPGALAAAVAAMLRDRERLRAMGAAARERIREQYPLERCLDRTEAFLLRTAGKAPPTSSAGGAPGRG